MGKPKEQAEGEVEFSAAIYQYYADNAAKLLADQPIDLLDGEGSAFIRRSPVGTLLGIKLAANEHVAYLTLAGKLPDTAQFTELSQRSKLLATRPAMLASCCRTSDWKVR